MMAHEAHHMGHDPAPRAEQGGNEKRATVVLHTGGLNWASEKAFVEAVLGRRLGVQAVEANPVAQTATITYDPERHRSPN